MKPPAIFETLLKRKSTVLIVDHGNGSRIYRIKITTADRIKHYKDGRPPYFEGLEIKPMNEIAGIHGGKNSGDYVLIDRRELLGARKIQFPPKG